jgi:hypothetical protein
MLDLAAGSFRPGNKVESLCWSIFPNAQYWRCNMHTNTVTVRQPCYLRTENASSISGARIIIEKHAPLLQANISATCNQPLIRLHTLKPTPLGNAL